VAYGHSVRPALVSSILAAVLLLPVSGCDLLDKDEAAANQTIEVPGQGVSFEVPSDWDALDTGAVTDAGDDSGYWDEMADRMGVEPEQMKNLVSQADIFIGAPSAEGGVLSNINVMHFPGAAMPASAGSFELQFRSLGAKDIQSTPLSTNIGDGFRIEYVLPINGKELNGTALVIKHDSIALDITISASSAEVADDLADQIVGSLAATD